MQTLATILHVLRYDLIDSDHIAFMFNVGTFPDMSIHPIDRVPWQTV